MTLKTKAKSLEKKLNDLDKLKLEMVSQFLLENLAPAFDAHPEIVSVSWTQGHFWNDEGYSFTSNYQYPSCRYADGGQDEFESFGAVTKVLTDSRVRIFGESVKVTVTRENLTIEEMNDDRD